MNKYVDTYVLHPFVCIITYRSFCLCLAIYVCVHIGSLVVQWLALSVLPSHSLVVQIPPGEKGVCHSLHTSCCE